MSSIQEDATKSTSYDDNYKVVIQGATKIYGKFKALDNVSIKIEPGTIHGIIGENGAGKTTLIKALVGIQPLDEGSIQVDGEAVYENNKIKQKIAYVADQNQYFKSYKLKQLVTFYEDTYNHFSREKFEKYNIKMKLDLNKKITQLSKGMQMRLSLMLSLACNPELLVLDEPTSGLDAIVKKEILEWILDEVDVRGMTVLISSHHLAELERICDTMSMIHSGVITYQSSVDELKEKVKKIQVVFEGDAPQDLKMWEGILDVSQIGSVYYIVTKSYDEDLLKRLQERGIKLVEIIPLTLEEIFIYTNRE